MEIENVELLGQDESDDLITFYRVMMSHVSNITILHYAPIAMHTRVLDALAGFNNLDFMTMYLNTVFPGLSRMSGVSFHKLQESELNEIDEYFAERGLVPGKTVILFPYANTIEPLPWQYWEEMARHLRERGLSVCTNTNIEHQVIPGTKQVFVPYNHLIPFVECAGYVVGLRSGVFDILAYSRCYKFLFYPTPNFYKFGVGTIFDYFSLGNMGIGIRAFEYEFERIYDKELFQIAYNDICSCAGVDHAMSARQYTSLKRALEQKHVTRVLTEDMRAESDQ